MGIPGVYIGSGDMPEGYNVQIDPNGDSFSPDEIGDIEAALDSIIAIQNALIGGEG